MISCLHRLKPVAINLLSMIVIEWGVPICSRAHKKETPHDVGDIFYFTIVQIVWAVVGLQFVRGLTKRRLSTTWEIFFISQLFECLGSSGFTICSRAHKKETPHDVGDIFYFTIVQIVWAVVGLQWKYFR